MKASKARAGFTAGVAASVTGAGASSSFGAASNFGVSEGSSFGPAAVAPGASCFGASANFCFGVADSAGSAGFGDTGAPVLAAGAFAGLASPLALAGRSPFGAFSGDFFAAGVETGNASAQHG